MMSAEPHPPPTPLQQAGVAAAPVSSKALSMHEVTSFSLLRLHSLMNPATIDAALEEAGISVPRETGAVTGEEPAVLCLRPGEWLLICGDAASGDWIERLSPLLDSAQNVLLDLSDGLGVFRVSGPAAPWLLAKFSGLDFLAGTGEGRHGASTRFADIAVIVYAHHRKDGDRRFDLICDRSVAPYLWSLLEDGVPHAEELFERHGAAA